MNIIKTALISSLFILTSCGTMDWFEGKEKTSLDGDRLSLYDFEKTLQQDPNTKFGLDGTENENIISLPTSLVDGNDEKMRLMEPWTNNFWPQVGGYPNHSMKHLNFTKNEPKKLWSKSIGKGGTDRVPLSSTPIMAQNTIFTLNNNAQITAINAISGKNIWQTNVIKQNEDEVVISGGLAYSGNMLFATNGFNELLALNPDNGDILWRADTKTPIRAAPAAVPGRVFVTTMDNTTIAFDAHTGKKIWSHRGLNSEAGVLGAASPAITRDAVISVYSSGEIYALQINTGIELWSENLSPVAHRAGKTEMSDIRALPVADSGFIYAASYNNKMKAIDARTGQTVWQSSIGTPTTPWVSGNRIYIMTTQGELTSLDRNNGQTVWQTNVQRYEDIKDREDVINWQGPILAGNRIMIFGSHGLIQSYSPVSGKLIREWDASGDIFVAPLMANETLYLLENSGDISAWK